MVTQVQTCMWALGPGLTSAAQALLSPLSGRWVLATDQEGRPPSAQQDAACLGNASKDRTSLLLCGASHPDLCCQPPLVCDICHVVTTLQDQGLGSCAPTPQLSLISFTPLCQPPVGTLPSPRSSRLSHRRCRPQLCCLLC